jgi:8-oxo-dGTP pyrophosphatase MutT (NUDIX family)
MMIRAPILGLCTLLLVLVSQSPTTQARQPEGAGLLVHCVKDGKRWILLGHDRRGFWEILGGHSELRKSLDKGQRRETPLETAAREGFEESRMLLPYHEILTKARRLGRSQGFTIFTLESAHIPRPRFRETFIPVGWKAYDEMDDYAWVEVTKLLAEVRSRSQASEVRLSVLGGKREIRGLRPALFIPLKKLTNLWGLLLGEPKKPATSRPATKKAK